VRCACRCRCSLPPPRCAQGPGPGIRAAPEKHAVFVVQDDSDGTGDLLRHSGGWTSGEGNAGPFGDQLGADEFEQSAQGIRILLGLQDTPGAPIKANDVELLVSVRRPVKPALQILAETGMLEDDRTPRLDARFAGKVADLPEQMAAELRIWFEVSHRGSTSAPRMRPRSPITIKVRLRSALPTLHAWAAAGHTSLREISHNDVVNALPPSGNPRALLGAALKSIFSVLKSRKIVFVNPAARIATGKPEDRQPLPTEVSMLRRLLKPDEPARAALTALLAFHALRSGQLRAVLLTDVHDCRLAVDGRSIPLADLVRHRLGDYLDYRNRRWPNTPNPHLFITQSTAIQTKPVTDRWIRYKLEGITAQAIREDRILHEAHVTDGDARRLGDLFGLSVKGATRYTATVDHPAIADLDTPC
jgi:hypothetical protein